MLRVIASATLFALLLILCSPPQADADILVGKKNGDLVECKALRVEQAKDRFGNKYQVYVVKLEDGKEKKYSVKEYALIRRKPSWEARAEEKEWYTKEAPKVKDTWKNHYNFARRLNSKKYLDEEMYTHYKKAYDLRKPEIKDTEKDHTVFAKTIERWGLYEEAKEEWRWVYAEKKKSVDDVKGHMSLAKWCIKEGLLYEALDEYNAALALEPENRSAKKGLEKLRKAMEVPVFQPMLKMVRAPLASAIKALAAKQNQDGSFGSDISEAGVHGKHGMTAMTGHALISKWEFDTLENLDLADDPPKELKKCLDFVLTNKDLGTGLRGPDVWGPIFRIGFLARLYKKEAFRGKREAIKKRFVETMEEMNKVVRSDGGWAYYDFVTTSITFVTAAAIVQLVEAKKNGLPVPDATIAKACEAVLKCKQGASLYSYRPGVQEAPVGCAGRSSLCEMALMLAGKSQGGLKDAVTNFFRHRHLLEAIKGQSGTHIGEGKTAPYYYLFGHYWTTRSIKYLPKGSQLALLKKMAGVFLKDQERDGSFVDWTMTKDHKVYGAAFGAMILYELARQLREK